MYTETFEKQGITISQTQLLELRQLLTNLIKKNMLLMFISKNKLNTPTNCVLYVWDKHRAYYLFGASSTLNKSNHGGSFLLWKSFHHLNQSRILEVDLEGINSPNRGWFKLSFGGNINPYYQIRMKKND